MNDMSLPSRIASVEPEPRKHCWHCSRSYTEDDVQIIWAEQNCTRWDHCPFNLTDGEP